jgi:hypothetical protein
MLQVTRRGKVVWVRFSTDLTDAGTDEGKEVSDAVVWFRHECPDIISADLMCRYLDTRLDKAVEKTRRTEYLKGYTDGRGKKHRACAWPCFLER